MNEPKEFKPRYSSFQIMQILDAVMEDLVDAGEKTQMVSLERIISSILRMKYAVSAEEELVANEELKSQS